VTPNCATLPALETWISTMSELSGLTDALVATIAAQA
jgi:hypothetical protein